MITVLFIVTNLLLIFYICLYAKEHDARQKLQDDRDYWQGKAQAVEDCSTLNRNIKDVKISFLEDLAKELVMARTFETKRAALICTYILGSDDISADVSERLMKVLNETYPWKAERLMAKNKKQS